MAGAALRRAGQAIAPLLAGRSASLFEATWVFASHPLPASSSTQHCISSKSTKFLEDALSQFKLSPFSSQHLNLQASAQIERLSEEEAIAMLTPMGAPSSSFLEEGMILFPISTFVGVNPYEENWRVFNVHHMGSKYEGCRICGSV